MVAPAHFRPADVPAEHREWLRRKTDDVIGYAYRTVCDYVRIGLILAEVRAKLRKRLFKAWVDAELPFGRQWAYKLMAIADAFAAHVSPQATQRIDTPALVLLAHPSVPPQARTHALGLADDGERVTARVAREILDAHRPTPTPDRESVRGYDRLLKAIRGGDATPAPAVGGSEWAVLEDLVSTTTLLNLSHAQDDADGDPLFAVTAYFPDGRRVSSVRRTLGEAVRASLGREEVKTCPTCETPQPVGKFGRNASQKDGLNRCCKTCERPRLAALKRRKKAAKAS